jgi:hypothetical protein
VRLERDANQNFSVPLDAPRKCSATRFSLLRKNGRKLSRILIAVGVLLTDFGVLSQSLAQVSPFEYQLSKLRAESARLQREKAEFFRDRKIQSLRVSSYNNDLISIVAEFQNHIADQHHHFVSCKKCRQFTKQMSALSKRIERGVR